MRECIFKVLKNPIPVYHKGGHMYCADWYPFYADVVTKMSTAVPTENVFVQAVESAATRLNGCSHCIIVVNSMKTKIRSTLATISGRPLLSFLD